MAYPKRELEVYEILEIVRKKRSKEEKIKTGWDWLDTRLDGGFLEQGRSMYIFAGPTNVGKSIFLSNVASNAAAQGKNVLVVSLEMSEMIYCKRITSKLTGLPINRLDEHVDELREKVGQFKMTHPRANMIIKDLPRRHSIILANLR